MKCPVCSTVDLLMSERQGIEIDYCPQCRGIWLDRGELDKIIARSTQPADHAGRELPANLAAGHREQAGYAHGQHGHDDHDHHGRSQHGRKSFWQELFD